MLVRKAVRGDEVAIMDLIHGLAEYENSLHSVDNTATKLAADLFDHRYCEAFVAEVQDEIVGFALFYTSYSTWKGPCIYLKQNGRRWKRVVSGGRGCCKRAEMQSNGLASA